MNERIREFVSESNLDIYGLGKDRYRWEYTIQKFAEMIVKECAQIAKTAEPWKSDDLILKHFGVNDDGR